MSYRLEERMPVLGADGASVGRVARVLFGETSREPRFFTIETGLVFTREHLVPREAVARVDDGGRVHLALSKEEVERLPAASGRDPIPEEAREALEALGARRRERGHEFDRVPLGAQAPGQPGTDATGRLGVRGRRYRVDEERVVELPARERERLGYRSAWSWEPYLAYDEFER